MRGRSRRFIGVESKRDDSLVVSESMRDILHAAQRGAALTHRLLAFAGRRSSAPKVFDLGENLEKLWRMIQSVLGERIHAQLERGDHPIYACVDVAQFERVVLNLVLNARDAMQDGGSLRITLRDDHDADERGLPNPAIRWASISIEDTGTGIDPAVSDEIFDPFFTTKAHGTGLGLASARSLLHEIGGDLTVQSRPGSGSTFSIWLPAAARRGSQAIERELPLQGGSEHILLVEDQSDLRSVAQRFLQWQGYTVTCARDGIDALERYHATPHSFDILVSDIIMPRLGGIPLARAIRSDAPELPILFISGHIGEDYAGPKLGPNTALLTKPFAPNSWLAKIRELLDGPPPSTTGLALGAGRRRPWQRLSRRRYLAFQPQQWTDMTIFARPLVEPLGDRILNTSSAHEFPTCTRWPEEQRF